MLVALAQLYRYDYLTELRDSPADLHNMKGAVVDAMAVAIDGADAMLSCVSLAYKESANCRMEAQYGHQQNVDMIPLVRQLSFTVVCFRWFLPICAKSRCCR